MKKILITGAAGFIGFHLSLFLKKRGDWVLGLDNFNSYYSLSLKREREKLLNQQGIKIINENICNSEKLKEIIEENQITNIVHLAAQAGVRYSLSNPNKYVSSNLEGFVSMMEACKHFPTIPVVYASSSSVYGLNKQIPFKNTDRTDKPANLYGATKKANELIAHAYHNLYKIPMTGLRYFTVYGPWGRPDMAYYSFTKNILAGEAINLFNKGDMQRDFTYIDDIVKGTAAAIDKSFDYEIFNLGNNQPKNLSDLIISLETLLGKKAKFNLLPMPKEDLKTTFADISSSQQQLNFFPQTPLEKGLENFINWYLTYHK
jgi:UDP-glucuronate 4-epimerase